ncbi:Sulfoxide reductase catalytic subunit YedY precursor [Enhygromyxa salina]|uniref:Sulfoxide reductase catalytic subunit YedY n=1 Tax=Enhygromyxa salina TaxID=215803 RepID=A0A2S9XBN7_9BACT|nr:molybdopterin-dependent oxidoreductase [Enhygromyxa salina]PRP90269.1 Sulfoxide reductase catalytic subunit YedY precursor [Enhygromyxa salina]
MTAKLSREPDPTLEELAREPARRPAVLRAMARRRFLQQAGAGATVLAFGGIYTIAEDGLFARAKAETRADGRPRVPPGQQVITKLRPMGGEPGDTSKSKYRLRIHGEVSNELDLGFRDLLKITQVTRASDVHCVTGWTVLGAKWTGVQLQTLAKRAGVKDTARFVIFEAAHGYTANVPLADALADEVMVAHKLDGAPLTTEHGAPMRAVVPDLYFWKSAKWLTGIRFVRRDESGYWERRGYSNRGDPWTEDRYS